MLSKSREADAQRVPSEASLASSEVNVSKCSAESVPLPQGEMLHARSPRAASAVDPLGGLLAAIEQRRRRSEVASAHYEEALRRSVSVGQRQPTALGDKVSNDDRSESAASL